MKFLLTYQGDRSKPPTPETMAAIGQFGREMAAKGVLLMTGGLVRPNTGTKLRYAGGKHTVIDGPFPETKELIDGFALVQAGSLGEAIELGQKFMSIAGEGDAEVLQVFDASEGGPPGPG
ncbi:MAG TPA: YciI family protein [Polyangiaceae bacterium]|nr:YciI family protein [Polyangiaceae bacterium]